jgi:hypothetical protein
MEPQNAREAIVGFGTEPPKPLGIVFMVTLPSVKDEGVPATQDM